MRFLSVLLLLGACGKAQTGSKTIVAEGFDRADVRNDAGQVQVTAGNPGGEAALSWRGKVEPELTSRVAGSTLLISGSCPDGTKACEIDLALSVPAEVDVDVTNGVGDVVVSGINGVVDLEISTGDVLVDNAAGNVRVDVDAGDITLSNIEARLEISTVAGTLVGTDLTSPTLDVTVISGSVDLTFLTMPELVEIITDDGDITLRMPRGDYDIDASSRKGEVEIVDVTNTSSASSVIIVSSESGDIRISAP